MDSFELQRRNMVENQVRPSDVTDRRIIRAMLEVPRERFVAEDVRTLAYSDQDVPMMPAGHATRSRCLLRPSVMARMIQALDLDGSGVVLDLGCGTGYGSALLARLAGKVVALDEHAELAQRATANLGALAVSNAEVVTGPLASGWDREAPYDAILVEGAVAELPRHILDQLKDGGRLVALRLDEGMGQATRWLRDGISFGERVLFDAAAPVLPGFERQPQFVF